MVKEVAMFIMFNVLKNYFYLIFIGLISLFFFKQKRDHNKEVKSVVKSYEKEISAIEDVLYMDDVDVCINLGGLPDECSTLRSSSKSSGVERSGRSNKKRT